MSKQTGEADKYAFEAIFNSSVEGIMVVNNKGKIIIANPACHRLFGYDENLVGKMIEDLIPIRFKKKHVSHRKKYSEKPKSRGMGQGINLLGMRKDGSEMPVEVSLSHTNYNGKLVTVGFIIDISERIKAEDALKRSEEQLIIYAAELEKRVMDRTKELEKTVKKLESEVIIRKRAEQEAMISLENQKELNDLKSRFVSMASHEFRTPLSTILSSASLIDKYEEVDKIDKRKKHIGRIKNNVNELTGILNDFLLLGKLEEGKVVSYPENIPLKQFMKDVINEMILVLRKGEEIIYDSSEEDEIVFLDRQLFKNILVNLISNAIKYSEDGRKIFIKLQKEQEMFEIGIKDQGMGIPKADQAHLFERFFRAHNVTHIQGTGLGLNLVKKYIDLMNGKISYQSEEGKGSTFVVKLPYKMN